MTIRFGSLVGAKKQTVPPSSVPATFENGTDHVIIRDTILLAAAPIADAIEICHQLPWETVLSATGCTLFFDALGASTTLSIGDAAHPAALAAATSTVSAGSLNMVKTITIDQYFQPLWKNLGYATLAAAKAVAPSCQLLATIAGGAATGNVTWTMHGQRR